MEDVYSGAGVSVQALTAAWEVGEKQQTPNLAEGPQLCESLAAPEVSQGKEAPGGIAS